VGLAAGDDRFEKQVLCGFDHRHQVDVAIDSHHENALPRVALLIWVCLHVKQIARHNRHHHGLEAQLPLSLELGIFLRAPHKRLYQISLTPLYA
jgi:hypothetical protein